MDYYGEIDKYHPSNLLYTQERLSRYTLGGYHPVHLGETLKDGRYEVHHKLGWGGYSTVWLAYDTQQQFWVSIKIKTANSSSTSHELDYLRRLAQHGQSSSNYIVQLLDTFTHVGPNGSHQCLVFELLGPSLAKVLSDYSEAQETLEAEIILRLAQQVLTGIKFIHSAGTCHGDISCGNIAFRASNLSHATREEVFQALGPPECEDLVRKDGQPLDPGLPTQLVKASQWVDWIDEDEEDLRIIDFGEAFLQGEEPESLAQPGPLQVPEIIFTDRFDYRVDLWRAGIVCCGLIFQTIPFMYLGEVAELVATMIGFVEDLPDEWLEKWKSLRSGVDYELPIHACPPSQLRVRFNERVHDPELEPLVEVVERLMRFLPDQRINASEALDLLKDV